MAFPRDSFRLIRRLAACLPSILLCGGVVLLCLAASRPASAAEGPEFEAEIVPLLVRRCLECHSESGSSGGLVLQSQAALLKGGDSGPAIETADPAESLLLQRVADGEMPPEKEDKSQKLPDAEIALLRKWIAAGAPWPEGRVISPYEKTTDKRGGLDWWAFQPVKRVPPPTVSSPDRVAGSVDAFVIARLEAEGMAMAPPADRRALIRRATYDLLGLPPTSDEIEAFVADQSPDAYERLIDRLLASPHYGERWARYWLDLVRFAETNGYERDAVKPNAWRYRDWVVDSLNDDKPYDRFVIEQLAGDELANRSEETVIGTGLLRLGTWDDEPNDPLEYKYERLEDLVHVTSTAFLGVTVKCARCHDHKFDPIPQIDYYAMAAVFWAGYIEPRERELMGGPSHDELGFDVLGWTDRAREPPPLSLLKKGDPHRPAQEVEPGVPSLVPALYRPIDKPPEGVATSHRRLQLAQWIADPANPLPPRVLVNRLWQHHFAQGLVRSPDNFGFKGDLPTHPDLLDWLADEFVSGGWQIKRMHRRMMLSEAYRQESIHPRETEYSERDFGNHLLWRMNRQRLDAEAMRDSMLAAAGRLDLRMGGPSFFPHIDSNALEGLSRKGGAWTESPPAEQRRRSLYIFTKRSLLVPLMTTFDFADSTLPCGQRDVSVVAPQALALLNNRFVHQQSQSLALRVASVSDGPRQQVRAAWQLALGRLPTDDETQAALAHLDAQRRRFAERLGEPIDKPRPESDDGQSPQPSTPDTLPQSDKLVLWLRADRGVDADEHGRVRTWQDQSPAGHHAAQDRESARPLLARDAISGRPALRFDGQARFLHVGGQVLDSQQHTVFAVANDTGGDGLREIFSNWNGGAGNSVTSAFLGLSGKASVRFSDNFAPAGEVTEPARHFILSAVSSESAVAVYQNGGLLARRESPLAARNLETAYVVGTQGNINGEFWNGDIAELIVFNRALDDLEQRQVTMYLAERYGIDLASPATDEEDTVPMSPELLALASLCHVLLNTNEFMYVD